VPVKKQLHIPGAEDGSIFPLQFRRFFGILYQENRWFSKKKRAESSGGFVHKTVSVTMN